MWDEITCPFQTSTVASLKLGNRLAFHPTLYCACDYFFMLGLKLIHVSKRGPRTVSLKCRQHYRDTCHISEWSSYFGDISVGFESYRNLPVRLMPDASRFWKQLTNIRCNLYLTVYNRNQRRLLQHMKCVRNVSIANRNLAFLYILVRQSNHFDTSNRTWRPFSRALRKFGNG